MKKTEGRGRRTGARRRTRLDRFQDDVRRAWRDFVRQVRTVLAGVGLAWVVWELMKLISG